MAKALRLLLRFWIFSSAFAFASLGKAAPPIPALTEPVMDQAGALGPDTRAYLNRELSRLWKEGGSQVAVLIIPTLEDEPIESYSIKVTDQWKLGDAAKDNGALLLIALNDRKMRIEVGQGNEGTLTDVASSRIIRQRIAPAFRQGSIDTGVLLGVSSIVSFTDPDFRFSEGEGRPALADEGSRAKPLSPLFIIIIVIFVFLVLMKGGGRGGPRGGRGAFWGGFGAGYASGGGFGGFGGRSSGGGFGGFGGGGGGFSGGGSSGSW